MNLEKIRDNNVFRLVQELGYAGAATELKIAEPEVRRHIVWLMGQNDFEYYAESGLYVEDDTKLEDKIVPFVLNSAQKKLLVAIETQKEQGKPIRLVHLKPRQYGASTFFEGYIYREVTSKKNRHATTISYVLESAEHLRGIALRFHDRFPFKDKPELQGRTAKTWRFPKLDSTWRIDSAENLQAGHSFTNQILHISELSRWERDVSTLMRGLTSSVQALPETMIIIESTANGYGDYFHEMWERAKRGSGYQAVFVAWFEIEKYKMPFYGGRTYDNKDTREQFERGLSRYEKTLIDRHSVTLEQLHWRRWKIEEDLKGDEDSFFEQYPANDEEAFLASGRPYFPATVVRERLSATQKAKFQIGNLEYQGGKIVFEEDRDGLWKVFSFPEEGWRNRYVTGSDPAEGISSTDDNKDPDFSVCTVFDRVTKNEVARFRGRVHTDVFENEIHKAILHYGSACDCVETNNTAGGAVIKGLKDREGVNLYRRQIEGKVEDKETEEYGFKTDKQTREILLSEFRLRIKAKPPQYQSEDEWLWRECQTFIIGKDGKPRAQYGAHDDVVFSAALTVEADNQAAETQPIERPIEMKKREPDEDELWIAEEMTTERAEF